MDIDEKRAVLEDIVRITTLNGAAEDESEDLTFFLPQRGYEKISDPSVFLIVGGRGSGKTKLFRTLTHSNGYKYIVPSQLQFGYPQEDSTTFIEAHNKGRNFCTPPVCEQYVGSEKKIHAFWAGCLCILLLTNQNLPQPEILDIARKNFEQNLFTELHKFESLRNPRKWIDAVENSPECWESFFFDVDTLLLDRDLWCIFTYDALDVICSKYLEVFPYVGALIHFWFSHTETWQRIKSKIFLRSDILNSKLLQFSDSSKLRHYQYNLEWDVKALYRLLVKRIANVGADGLAYVKRIPGLIFEPLDDKLGYRPTEDEGLLEKFAVELIGAYMGSDRKKGRSYPWVPNHIQDANGVVSPRPFLKCFAFSANSMLREDSEIARLASSCLLSPPRLQEALTDVSKDRVAELQEEYVWLDELQHEFNGLTMLMPKQEFISHIRMDLWSEAKRSLLPGKTPEEVFIALQQLGIVLVSSDNRVNVPEIYLHGFGMKRKGGIKRPLNRKI